MKKIRNLILVLLLAIVVVGCGDNTMVDYPNNVEEAEKYFNEGDGFLVVADPSSATVEKIKEEMKDDKYKDFQLKVTNESEETKKLKDNEGVINIVKKGKIIGSFPFDASNKATSLLSHAARMYNGESYTFTDNNFESLDNVVDLMKVKVENEAESRKFFGYKSSEQEDKSCKMANTSVSAAIFNINGVDCYYDNNNNENDNDEGTENLGYLDLSYPEIGDQNDIFADGKLKNTKYTIETEKEKDMLVTNHFKIKDSNGKTKMSGEADDSSTFFGFYNDDSKRFSYINKHHLGYAEFYYIFDKLDNTIYKAKDKIIENNGFLYFLKDNKFVAYDIAQKKCYTIVQFKNAKKLDFNNIMSIELNNNNILFSEYQLGPNKPIKIKLNLDKIEKLDVNWNPNLLGPID